MHGWDAQRGTAAREWEAPGSRAHGGEKREGSRAGGEGGSHGSGLARGQEENGGASPVLSSHFCRVSAGETCGCAGGEAARPAGPRGGGSPLSRLSLCPPQRHGLAVCLALTTMCTSLLLMYGGIGIGGGHPEPRRRQQQVAAVPSRPPERGQRHPALPVGAGLLEGYISVLEHKVSRRPRDRPSFPAPSGGTEPGAAELSLLPPWGARFLSEGLTCPACLAVGVGLSGLRVPSRLAQEQELPGSGVGLQPAVGYFCSAASLLLCTVERGRERWSVSNVVCSWYSTNVCLWWYQ